MLESLIKEPVFVTFAILFAGLAAAKIKYRGISLAGSAVFMAGFFAGMLGLKSSDHVMAFGLMLFMYAIGVHSGPSFFNSLNKKGLPFIIIALVVSASSMCSAILFGKIFNFPVEVTLGLFAGSLNSSSAVAILNDGGFGGALLPSYGVVYPLGLVIIVLFVQLLPAFMKVNLIKTALRCGYKKKAGKTFIIRRRFSVENPDIIGKKVHEIEFEKNTGAQIVRLRRDELNMTIIDNIRLMKNDNLMVVGPEESMEKAEKMIGREYFDDLAVDPLVESRQIFINNQKISNMSIEDLGILSKYHTIINKIWRNGIELIPDGNFIFEKGDIVTALGNSKNLDRLETLLGTKKALSGEFDLFSISFALALAFVFSKIKIPLPFLGFITFGISGGALLTGMVFGYLSYRGIMRKNMSHSAETILKDLGMGLFLAGIGTKSGMGVSALDAAMMAKMLVSSFLMMSFSMCCVFLICYKALKMDYIKSLACVCGGFNSSPAIATLTSIIGSEEPSSFFASVYPLSLFAIILTGQLMGVFIK